MLEIVYVFWIIFAFSMVYSLLSLFVSMGRNGLGLVPSHFKLDIIFLQVFSLSASYLLFLALYLSMPYMTNVAALMLRR